jgi:hypothetical protein
MTRFIAALFCAFVCLASIPAHAAQRCEASHYGHKDGYNGPQDGQRRDIRHVTAAMRIPQPFGSYVTVIDSGFKYGLWVAPAI